MSEKPPIIVMPGFWSALERIRGGSAVPWIWRRHLGEDSPAFTAAFLQRGARPVRFYPCPHDCGCAHEVIQLGPRDLVGACRCESWNCDDLPLTAEDIVPLELSWPKLGRSLARAFGLEAKAAAVGLASTRQIGSWSAAGVPVILAVQDTAAGFRRSVLELAARLRQPFILLAPTADHVDAACQELLGQAGAGFFSLEAHVTFSGPATLRVTQAPGELFARFTPEPKEAPTEDLARRAFALVQQLEAEPGLKAPSVLTVFRLYCLDNLSAGEVARKLHCSKPTVLRRLHLLRRKTGLEPQALRRLSAQLGELEHGVGDSRARHIHRRSLIYDEEDEEQQ